MKKISIILFLVLLINLPVFTLNNDFSMLFYGEASWYGGKFQGRKTANGEKFDTNKMTAAHKTLPFGTLVKVTNLENDKNVVVRINDRGPFVKNRILDLSCAAAKILDIVKKGTAKVEVRVIKVGNGKYLKNKEVKINKPKVIKSSRKLNDDKKVIKSDEFDKVKLVRNKVVSGKYIIQIGAFSRKDNAVKFTAQLRKNGISAFVFTEKGSSLYKVWIGYYNSYQDGYKKLNPLKKINKNAFLRKV